MEKPRSCPKCGSDKTTSEWTIKTSMNSSVCVRCINCGFMGPSEEVSIHSSKEEQMALESLAIDKWNSLVRKTLKSTKSDCVCKLGKNGNIDLYINDQLQQISSISINNAVDSPVSITVTIIPTSLKLE